MFRQVYRLGRVPTLAIPIDFSSPVAAGGLGSCILRYLMLCLSRLGQGIPGLGGFRISSCDPECVQASIEGQPGILQTRKRFFFGGRVRGFTKSSARPLSCREVSALIPTFFGEGNVLSGTHNQRVWGLRGHSRIRFEGKKTGSIGQSSNDSGARC